MELLLLKKAKYYTYQSVKFLSDKKEIKAKKIIEL